MTTGELPIPIKGLVQQIKSFERIAQAAVMGDYNTALLVYDDQPLVPSDRTAKKLLDEMLWHTKNICRIFLKENDMNIKYYVEALPGSQ